MYLAFKTNDEQAQLVLVDDSNTVDESVWSADRQLSNTIFYKLQELLKNNNLTPKDLQGLIFYKGPGGFTGLRISASVVNALANNLNIKIACTTGNNWLKDGVNSFKKAENLFELVEIDYGREPNITKPKK